MRFFSVSLVAGVLCLGACAEQSTPTTPSEAPAFASRRVFEEDGARVSVMGLNPFGRGAVPGDVSVNASGMIYHGGPILPVTRVVAIYWATSPIYAGGPAAGTTGTGAQDGSLIGHFLRNFGGSPYFNINTTYYDNSGPVQNSVQYTGYWANNTSVPRTSGRVSDRTIQSMIVSGFNSGKYAYNAQTIYVVFTAGKTNLGGGFGTQYCAYHGAFTWNGQKVIYAAQPYNNAYPSGCSTQQASPNNDPGADREINTLAHEIEEAATDPWLNAWYDASGAENADKCAWTFGTTYTTANGGVANMNLGGKDFLIQRNYSNAGNGGCFLTYP